jgi:hypothetical protein
MAIYCLMAMFDLNYLNRITLIIYYRMLKYNNHTSAILRLLLGCYDYVMLKDAMFYIGLYTIYYLVC